MLHVVVCFESCQHLDCSDLVAGILCSRVKQWQVLILKEMLWRTFFKRCKQQSDVDRTEIGRDIQEMQATEWRWQNWDWLWYCGTTCFVTTEGGLRSQSTQPWSQTMLPKITKVLINEKCITCKILALWYAIIVPSLTNSHLSVFCSHHNGLEQIPLSAWKKNKNIYIYI